MQDRLKYVTRFAALVAVWNAIGVISRVEYIARKVAWIWKATTVDLSLAVNIVLLAGSGAWLTYYRMRRQTAPERAPALPCSPADQELLSRARGDLGALDFAQRVALRLIYKSPGQFVGAYIRQMETLGLQDAEAVVKYVIGATVLVNSSPQMRLSQSPHRVVEQLVEDEMAKPTWAWI